MAVLVRASRAIGVEGANREPSALVLRAGAGVWSFSIGTGDAPVSSPAHSKQTSDPALDRSWEGEIQKQLVRDLYERSLRAVVLMLGMTGVIGWAIAPALRADAGVRVAFGMLIAVTLGRLLLALVPEEHRERRASVRIQYIVFTVGIALSAISLGALVVLSWPLLDPARIAIVAVLTSGVVSGAVMSLGFCPMVYMHYMIPPVGALFVMALADRRPPWGAEILATAFALYAVAVFLISLDQRRTRRNAIVLGLQLSELVVRDTLTKLHNRRFLQEFMTAQSARIARDANDLEHGRQPVRDSAIGIYILDLDFFKQVNDTHGHAAGDAVLKQTAEALKRAMRKSDNLVRWGGEEFVAVAWVKEPDHVSIVAEKLRNAIEVTTFTLPDGQTLRKTVSLGFCSMPFSVGQPRMLAWEQVLSLADAALYLAKAEGRNRWVGVTVGATRWTDTEATCADVVQDLQRATERGLIRLDRMLPAGKRIDD
jgi:diguanylate cyclase (GGDEF)-like protein